MTASTAYDVRVAAGRRPGRCWLPVLLCALGGITNRADAICVEPPDPEIGILVQLSAQNPRAALARVSTVLAANASTWPAPRRAWLHAVEADAYWQLSDTPGFAQAVGRGRVIEVAAAEPVRVQLLIQHAFRDFRTDTFQASIPQLQAARADVVPGSPEDICLQATVGDMQRMTGDAAPAVANLLAAYHAAADPARERQRIYAAYALSLFMRSAGDHDKAMDLLSERTQWDARQGHAFKLGGDYFRMAKYLRLAGRNAEALEHIRLAKGIGSRYADRIGLVYYDLEECVILVQLQQPDAAEPLCRRAASEFATDDQAMLAEAEVWLADILFTRGQPVAALLLLDSALGSATAMGASTFSRLDALRLRARVHDALGQYRQAYRDLEQYLALMVRRRDTESARYRIAAEAEDAVKREIARNRSLEQQLQHVQAQARLQRQRSGLIVALGVIVIAMLGLFVQVMLQRRRKLKRIADTDALTGLLNRRRLLELAEPALAKVIDARAPLSVVMLDLDHFKRINDSHGHAAGDDVLRRFSAVLQSTIRGRDLLARWGGEEFLLVLPDTTPDAALALVTRIHTLAGAIETTFAPSLRITFSAGISGPGQRTQTLDGLIGEADVALYAAKAAGRDRSHLWTPQLQPAGIANEGRREH